MIIKGMIKDCYLAKQPKITDNTYNVSITGDTEEEILYTIDGTDPIINGIVYKAPFKVDKDCIVEARTVNEWSHSSSAFADVKKSKTEIKPLTERYQDRRMYSIKPITNVYNSPFYYQYKDGRDEWTLFLCIGYCCKLNANLYTATYTTASGNTEGFKISVKNGDLYFDVYREGVIDESIVLAKKFGIEYSSVVKNPIEIQYLIINSKGQINGEQKFKPIVANGNPTFSLVSYATVGDENVQFGFYDYCIYSGIKEDLDNFYITDASVGKIELYSEENKSYVQAKGRGNIYITQSYNTKQEYVDIEWGTSLYTGYNFQSLKIRNYNATSYPGNGKQPLVSSTVIKTIQHTVILRQDINASNFENGDKIFVLEDNKTIFLYFKGFVPQDSNSEVSLCQVLDENDNITHEIVLTPGTGYQVKRNGVYETIDEYQSSQPNFIVSINKNKIGLNDSGNIYTAINVSDIPSNPKIKINAPTVPLKSSDWEIGRIAASDNGKMLAGNIHYSDLYMQYYD